MRCVVAEVAVENTAYSFDMLYSYRVPEALIEKTRPGCRVMVSFGRSALRVKGMVFSVEEKEIKNELKDIIAVLDEAPLIGDEGISLAGWLKDRTFCTLYDAVRVQLPAGADLKFKISYVSVSDTDYEFSDLFERKIYDFLEERKTYVSQEEICDTLGIENTEKYLKNLTDGAAVLRNYDTVRKVGDAKVKTVRLTDKANEDIVLSKKQESVVSLLRDVGVASVKEICYFTGITEAVIKNLTAKGITELFDSEIYRRPRTHDVSKGGTGEIILTGEQQTAYEGLLNMYGKTGCALLYGVTGSGKTSVYMKLIDSVLSDGRGIIVMVPEISLTPALISLFNRRYGDKIAVFHSGLSLGERYDEWKRVKNGQAQIAVGTRSAVFAPFENTGLIIMDEEQEHTYKSEQSPKYHARDVAKFRASYNNALLVLTSATPSVETYTYALKGRYSLFTIKNRYGNAVLPRVILADMRRERKNGNRFSLSSILLEKLEENLKNGKQSILLINRRGYNTFASCDECGHVRTCPNCSVSLTYHADNGRLMCHYCGYSDFADKKCPECGKNSVRFSGSGTQKIEQELKELLPGARIVRMDTDSTLSRYAHEDKLNSFAKGEYDILLGTQMVAKGLDFENVTLVGVLNADMEINGGDYAAGERAFSLLTQVVGRAGRGENEGLAIIQTSDPDSFVIGMAKNQDYEAFYGTEITTRKYTVYPPFCDIAAVTFSGDDELKTLAASRCFLFGIKEAVENKYKEQKIIVLGPMPPKISKVGGKYKYRIIIKCRNNREFRDMLRELLLRFSKNSDFRSVLVSTDINPESLA